ncbi:hypothetical protein [Atopococcus tabaci]|uniref:hypothetical protein n=1 Tax=Atopococcus tabaci TaxID=269774 RepID=UPI00240959D3|nr:hypothetical protein [Atopococcus tabaci]
MAMTVKQKRKLLATNPPKPKTYTEAEMFAFGERLILSYLASSLVALRDRFGFGKERMERFLTAESIHAQAIKENYVTADEILAQMKTETGFDLQEFIHKRSEEMAE